MKTLLDTLNSGTQWLEKRGIDDARKNMQLLLCHVLGFDNPMSLYTDFDRPMKEEELTPLREMLKKRSQNVPLQHLLGTVEFYNREFNTDGRGLIPRPETEELADLILKEQLNTTPRILDMGTGSGVLGLTIHLQLEDQGAETTLVDFSPDALSLAKENAQKLSAKNVTFTHSNLFQQVEGKFDIIAANLPYIPESDRSSLSAEVGHDPDMALFSGADGLDLIRDFVQQAANFLNENGLLAMEIGINQHKQVEMMLDAAGFSAIHTKSDLNGVERFPMARK